jgi:hypothetical protein
MILFIVMVFIVQIDVFYSLVKGHHILHPMTYWPATGQFPLSLMILVIHTISIILVP